MAMFTGFLGATLLAVLACTLGVGHAHADIYTWVDPTGMVNVSNQPPPEGVRVISITHEIPQKIAARYDAARDAARQAELQILSDRVRQLEVEVELAQHPAPPPQMEYPAIVQSVWAPVYYQIEIAPPAASGCDTGWLGCGAWWSPGFYPASVAVPRSPIARRGHPAYRGPGFGVLRPLGVSGSFRGR